VSFVDIIGASMSETLSSELRLSVCLLVCLFVGLSVCLSVCHGSTVNLPQITSGSYFARFASRVNSKNHLRVEDMNHGQSNSSICDGDNKDGDHS